MESELWKHCLENMIKIHRTKVKTNLNEEESEVLSLWIEIEVKEIKYSYPKIATKSKKVETLITTVKQAEKLLKKCIIYGY